MIRKFVLGSAITLLALAGTAEAAVAPAAHSSSVSTPSMSAPCHTTQVTLHGTAKPTTKCLDSAGGVTLDAAIGLVSCPDRASLAVFQNGPINTSHPSNPPGHVLCVIGQGTLPLTNIVFGGINWNDVASSWWAGCSGGTFWQNAAPFEAFGADQGFVGGNPSLLPGHGGPQVGNFTGQGGSLPNDSLSEIYLNSACGS